MTQRNNRLGGDSLDSCGDGRLGRPAWAKPGRIYL